MYMFYTIFYTDRQIVKKVRQRERQRENIPGELTLHRTIQTTLKKKPFENIEGKGNQHFLPFPQCFLLFPYQISIFSRIVICKCFFQVLPV